MIDQGALATAGIVFACLALVAVAAWLAHAAYATLRERRVARRRPVVLRSLASALQSGENADALAQLRLLAGSQALDVLVEMAHTVAGVQRERLDVLARSWGVLERADRWARSRGWAGRLRAARLIALFGSGDELCGDPLLTDPHPDVRSQAAEWAGNHPDRRRVAVLVEMLGDPELRCRFAAREALADAGRAAIPELAAALSGASGPAVAGALDAARSIAVPEFLPPAIGRMMAPEAEIRARAASLGAAIGGPEAVRALELLAADPDPEVRAAAAAGLGHLGRWEAATSIAGLLADASWRTRRAAALSLRRMGPTGELLLRRGTRAEGPAADTARSALELPPAIAASEERERVP